MLSRLRHALGRSAEKSPAEAADDAAALRAAQQAGAITAMQGRLDQLQQENAELRALIRHEALRLDFALGEIEGLAALREEFQAARKTPEYQAAFTEAEPLVSVCVITLNRSQLLIERCIASLQAQTYKNLQIIVVGDHCTDDTAERLAQVGDSRIEFHNLESRSVYPAPGRDRWLVAGTTPGNAARSLARGRFITHLDEDDTYDPERIEIAVNTAQRTWADFVWHKFFFQQPDGTWKVWGNGSVEYSQIGMGMILYHSFFARLPADLYAYRVGEPGDWNLIRRMKYLRPRMQFIDQPLTYYYRLPAREPFVAHPDETYLD